MSYFHLMDSLHRSSISRYFLPFISCDNSYQFDLYVSSGNVSSITDTIVELYPLAISPLLLTQMLNYLFLSPSLAFCADHFQHPLIITVTVCFRFFHSDMLASTSLPASGYFLSNCLQICPYHHLSYELLHLVYL